MEEEERKHAEREREREYYGACLGGKLQAVACQPSHPGHRQTKSDA